jgi:fatty-acid desaturase
MDNIYGRKNSTGTNWITAIFMSLFHVGAVAAFFFISWPAILLMVIFWWVAGSLGIGMGYHRLLTHRGYKTPRWMEYFLTICGTLALEGGPIFWVGTHRIHHQKSDRDGDPHTPREGAFWAHMGWILTGAGMHANATELGRYTPELRKDKFHVALTEYHWIPQVVVGVLMAVAGFAYAGIWGATSFVLWGVFFRVTYGLHATWLVNSATHLFGTRRFKTRDDSTNCWWVALLTFGEGWHNNHHAHPISARHGLAWYEFDMNWLQISALEKMGLAWDLKEAKISAPIIVMPDPKDRLAKMSYSSSEAPTMQIPAMALAEVSGDD